MSALSGLRHAYRAHPGVGEPRVLADGLDRPEGVAVAPDGTIWTGGATGQLYRLPAGSGPAEQVATLPGWLLGIATDAAGRVYVCAGEHGVLRYDPAGRAVDVYCDSADERPFVLANHAAFADDGALYVSDSGSATPGVADGRVVRIPAGGGDGAAIGGSDLDFPNGLAFDGPDLLVVESHACRVVRCTPDGRRASLGDLGDVVPDGIAVDVEGGVLISCFQPNLILRLAPDGVPRVVAEDWSGMRLLTPTNIAYRGTRNLLIASIGGDTIRELTVPWAGVPLHRPFVGESARG